MTRDQSLDDGFLELAISLAGDNTAGGGRPFGALVVRDGWVIATGVNEIHARQDPTAHAEMVAIREAAKLLGPDLSRCTIYASGHPCPMCLAAMHLSRIEAVRYAYSNEAAAPFGLSTAAVYADLARPFHEQRLSIAQLAPADAADPAIYRAWRDGTVHHAAAAARSPERVAAPAPVPAEG